MEDEYRKGSSGWSTMNRSEEFQETDVWSILNERKGFDSESLKSNGSSSSFTSRAIYGPSAARMIPRPGANTPDHEPRLPQQQSAPVNVPDWSKIYGKSNISSQNSAWLDHDHDDDGNDGKESWDSDDDDGGKIMPPHEWIAQKLARSQISSFSVCEGAGRTLKGRDLSRVRNAVLTKTGFLE